MGAPTWPPYPPTLGAPRRSRGAPRYSDGLLVLGGGSLLTLSPPQIKVAPAKSAAERGDARMHFSVGGGRSGARGRVVFLPLVGSCRRGTAAGPERAPAASAR